MVQETANMLEDLRFSNLHNSSSVVSFHSPRLDINECRMEPPTSYYGDDILRRGVGIICTKTYILINQRACSLQFENKKSRKELQEDSGAHSLSTD